MKEQRLGLEIVHVCFLEVGDSVLGVFCLEFFQMSHTANQDVRVRGYMLEHTDLTTISSYN